VRAAVVGAAEGAMAICRRQTRRGRGGGAGPSVGGEADDRARAARGERQGRARQRLTTEVGGGAERGELRALAPMSGSCWGRGAEERGQRWKGAAPGGSLPERRLDVGGGWCLGSRWLLDVGERRKNKPKPSRIPCRIIKWLY
jgi:hypothetical protein